MADPEYLTASAALSVAGTKIEFDLAIPSGPTVPSQLLPVFRGLADAIVNVAVERAKTKV